MYYCMICGLPLGRKRNCPRCKELKDNPIEGDCYYCKRIYGCTSASPRKKYKYCPMCGKELDKSRMNKRRNPK